MAGDRFGGLVEGAETVQSGEPIPVPATFGLSSAVRTPRPSSGDDVGGFPYPLGGKIYWVDVNHSRASDTNDGLSEDAPFKSIQRAVRAVVPADVVFIKPGTYRRDHGLANHVVYMRAANSGAKGKPIVFAAYGAGNVVLDGEGSCIPWYIDEPSAAGVNYIILRGLKFTRSTTYGIYIRNGNFILVEWCVASDNGSFGFYVDGGGYAYAGSYITIRFCEATRNLRTGIKVGSNFDRAMPHHVVVEFNYCHNNINDAVPGNTDGISAGGKGNDYGIIRGNVVHHNSDDGFDIGNGSLYWLFEANVIYKHHFVSNDGKRVGDGSGMKLGTYEPNLTPSGGHTIRYNVIFGNRLRAMDFAGNYRETTPKPPPLIVYNNTCFGRTDGVQEASDLIYLEEGDAVFRNNIGWDVDNGNFWTVRARGHAGNKPIVDSDYNLWRDRYIKDWDSALRTDLDANSLNGNPQFTDPYNITVDTDLHSTTFGRVQGLDLLSTSPALGAGVEIYRELRRLAAYYRALPGYELWFDALKQARDYTEGRQTTGETRPHMGAYPV